LLERVPSSPLPPRDLSHPCGGLAVRFVALSSGCFWLVPLSPRAGHPHNISVDISPKPWATRRGFCLDAWRVSRLPCGNVFVRTPHRLTWCTEIVRLSSRRVCSPFSTLCFSAPHLTFLFVVHEDQTNADVELHFASSTAMFITGRGLMSQMMFKKKPNAQYRHNPSEAEVNTTYAEKWLSEKAHSLCLSELFLRLKYQCRIRYQRDSGGGGNSCGGNGDSCTTAMEKKR